MMPQFSNFWITMKVRFPTRGASITADYTPATFAGAKPRYPLPRKGSGGRNAERGNRNMADQPAFRPVKEYSAV